LSFDAALQDSASLLLKMALAQLAPDALERDVPERERIEALARAIDPETTQLYYQIALQGREDLPLAPDEHAGFAMTILRMIAFRPSELGAQPAEARPVPASAGARAAPRPEGGTAAFDGDWASLVSQLPVTGAARELARHAELARFAGGVFELVVPKAMAHLADSAYRDKLRAALEKQLGQSLQVKVTAGEGRGASLAAREAATSEAQRAGAVRSVQADPFVKDLVTLFDGRVLEQSVQPAPKKA